MKVIAVEAPQTACPTIEKDALSRLQLSAAVIIASQGISSMLQLTESHPALAADLMEPAKAKCHWNSTSENSTGFIDTLKLPAPGFVDPKQAIPLYKVKDQYWLRLDFRVNGTQGCSLLSWPSTRFLSRGLRQALDL